MYPEEMVAPMRKELTGNGFKELNTPEEVQSLMENQEGTTLMVVNSVCGCAAGSARPGILLALKDSDQRPDTWATVFAGVDKEATEKAREYMLPYPPSSPSVALFKDGDLVHFVERHEIEGQAPESIANNLKEAFEKHCA
jgi:putative YphP/YqiW family bacilliredoxin